VFKTLLFVCSIAVPPENCRSDTAIDIISGPDAANEIMCGRDGQAFYAETALARGKRDDEYLKIVCIRGVKGGAGLLSIPAPEVAKAGPAVAQTTASP
jgi:hypothetical protein